MSNLSQLRAQFLSRIAESSTSGQADYTSDEMNSLANEAIRFTAVRTEYPRDHVNVTLESGKPVYAMPTDSLNIILAYLADSSNQNQKLLNIYSEKEMIEKRPDWMDESNTGEPDAVLLLDRNNLFVSPTPDSASAGKKLILNYNYYPATLSSDSETPDLPLAFHDLLPIYMAHSAYSGKLLNPVQAAALYTEYETKFKILTAPAVREKEQIGMFWKRPINLNDDEESSWVLVT